MQNEQIVRRIKARAAELGIKMSDLYRDCGLSSGAVSQWKTGKTTPTLQSIQRIAEYLKISPVELLGKTENPATEDGDGDMADLLQALRERPEMKMLFHAGMKATPETVRQTAKFLEGLAKGDSD